MALAVVSRPTDQDTDDLDLVTGVRAGDDRAFELLYLRYQVRITAYVRSMVHDHGRAEDITQEVFMAALRRMRETDREIAFKPWIYEIAKNACIDAFRRARNANEVSFDARDGIGPADHGRLAEPGLTPDVAVEGKVALDNLCGAFGGLSQTHHDILVMREFEGLSYREIGDRLGMSRPAVESTLFRARRRLSKEYEELVSGERCLRVQRIVEATGGRVAGLRDQRRMARHLAHCQPCRRYARLAGVDVDAPTRRTAAAARIAALLPLPIFLRRRAGADDATQLLGQHGNGAVAQWSTQVATVLDPGLVSGWSKAFAAAATVAVAGIGAGAAMTPHRPGQGFLPRTPVITSLSKVSGAAPAAIVGAGRIVGVGPRGSAAQVQIGQFGAMPRRGTSDPGDFVAPSSSGPEPAPGERLAAEAGAPEALPAAVHTTAGGPNAAAAAPGQPAPKSPAQKLTDVVGGLGAAPAPQRPLPDSAGGGSGSGGPGAESTGANGSGDPVASVLDVLGGGLSPGPSVPPSGVLESVTGPSGSSGAGSTGGSGGGAGAAVQQPTAAPTGLVDTLSATVTAALNSANAALAAP